MSSSEDKTPIKSAKKMDVFEGVDPAVRIRTKKMMMYFIIFAIVMLFGGFTSGLIVMTGGSYWVHIVPPTILNFSIAFLVISSLTMFLSLKMMKKGKKQAGMILIGLSFIGGIGFSATQYQGWSELSEKGMGFTVSENEKGLKAFQWNTVDRISGEYGVDYWVEKDGERVEFDGTDYFDSSDTARAYPVSSSIRVIKNNNGALIATLIFVHIAHLILGLIYMIVNGVRIAKERINQGDTIQLQVNGIYWHFMGLLWIYLFLFLFFIH